MKFSFGGVKFGSGGVNFRSGVAKWWWCEVWVGGLNFRPGDVNEGLVV